MFSFLCHREVKILFFSKIVKIQMSLKLKTFYRIKSTIILKIEISSLKLSVRSFFQKFEPSTTFFYRAWKYWTKRKKSIQLSQYSSFLSKIFIPEHLVWKRSTKDTFPLSVQNFVIVNTKRIFLIMTSTIVLKIEVSRRLTRV